ncbi:MAG: PQQ-binding-like beta-propeller repeat protein [Luteolibacter sp.]
MKPLPLWIIAALSWTVATDEIYADIRESRSFHILEPTKAPVSQVSWATDRIVVSGSRTRWAQAFDVETGKELWRKEFPKPISSLTCSTKHVFLTTDSSDDSIQRLGLETGEDTTPKESSLKTTSKTKVGSTRIGSPGVFLWNEACQALCVLQHELTMNSEEKSHSVRNRLFLHSPDSLNARPTIDYTGSSNPLASCDGTTLLLAERESQSCTLVDLSTGTGTLIYGPPLPEVAPEDLGGSCDTPALSNAFSSPEGSFIRVVDNFWSGGDIHFHPKSALPSKLHFPQGHIIAAVHWPTQRLLVSGMTTNLTLCNTSGEILEKLKNVTGARVWSMAFSPNGKKAAALNEKGEIKIFEIP